jgi:acetylornithine deacetylase/succinyl-diaminopimelate desuccinylase-like protein
MSKSMSEISTDRRALLGGAAATAALLGAGVSSASAAPADVVAIRKAAIAQQAEAIKRLQDWIKLPTITAEGVNVDTGPEYMMNLAREAGFQTVKRIPTDGTDGVFATLDVGAPRWVGVYFMYDVKQYDPKEWDSPPLEGRLVDKPGVGKVIVGRGAVNQKGPESAFLAAIHAFKAANKKLPVNIALVCEGEEEVASTHFKQVVTHPDVLPILKKCDGVFIPFTAQSATGDITIQLGAKGPIEFQLIADGGPSGMGPKADIHSSEKARVDSPIWRLTQAIASLTSPDGNTPMLDGYMDNVRPLTARQKDLIRAAAKGMNEEAVKKAYGVTHWINNESFEDSLIRLTEQPTINLQGLIGGYTGPGGKSILPTHAEAKLELRMVPNQTYEEVSKKLRAHLDKRGFTDIKLNISGGYDPTETDEKARIIQSALAAYKTMGVNASIFPRLAGSWPGSVFTQPPVAIPALQYGMGFGSGAHAPNEFFVIESANPKVAGYTEATMGYVELLYAIAQAK